MPERREFFKRLGQSMLGAGAAISYLPVLGKAADNSVFNKHDEVVLPCRLGNPDLTMATDP